MAGDNNKHIIWVLLLSLLAVITSFQQQLVVLYNLIFQLQQHNIVLPLQDIFISREGGAHVGLENDYGENLEGQMSGGRIFTPENYQKTNGKRISE